MYSKMSNILRTIHVFGVFCMCFAVFLLSAQPKRMVQGLYRNSIWNTKHAALGRFAGFFFLIPWASF